MSEIVLDPSLSPVLLGGVSRSFEHEACPTAQQLWDALDPAQSASSERMRVLSHCARCPACAQDLQITKVMREEELHASVSVSRSGHFSPDSAQAATVEQGQAAVLRPRWSSRVKREGPTAQHRSGAKPWLLPAATTAGIAAIAAAFALVFLPTKPSGEVTYRGEAHKAPSAQASPDTKLRAQGYTHQAGKLSWPVSQGEVASYQVTVVNSSFEVVCTQAGLEAPSLQLDRKSCPGLDRNQTFYWKVTSTFAHGGEKSSRFISVLPSP